VLLILSREARVCSQVHTPDHAAQHRGADFLDRLGVVDYLVVGRARIGHLEEQHRVNVDHQVVLRDDRLVLERHHLLAQVISGFTRSKKGMTKFNPGPRVLRNRPNRSTFAARACGMIWMALIAVSTIRATATRARKI